jgi:hypothetical protein
MHRVDAAGDQELDQPWERPLARVAIAEEPRRVPAYELFRVCQQVDQALVRERVIDLGERFDGDDCRDRSGECQPAELVRQQLLVSRPPHLNGQLRRPSQQHRVVAAVNERSEFVDDRVGRGFNASGLVETIRCHRPEFS